MSIPSQFVRSVIDRIIEAVVRKKFGVELYPTIYEVDVTDTTDDGMLKVHIDADVVLHRNDLLKLITARL